jgi:hypothetical protein
MNNLKFPKIIHQTWKTKEIPDEWKEYHRSWKKYNPDWHQILWTDDDSRKFIEKKFPEFLNIFDSYSYNIQRADAIRYFILYKYGGLYIDLDFECLQPIDRLLLNESFVIGYEPLKHANYFREKLLISNAFMASVPGHYFLLDIIKTMKTICPAIKLHNEVLTTTGPLMINNVLKKYPQHDICLLDEHVLYPFTSDSKELDTLINKKRNFLSLKKDCIENGTFAIHYYCNSWVRNLAGPLINPEPYKIDGYDFYPGMDSSGYDIGNAGRDIQKLVSECDRNGKALGFNTDGFLKYYIRPKFRWVKINNKNGNEGLYIRKNYLHGLKLYLQSIANSFKMRR